MRKQITEVSSAIFPIDPFIVKVMMETPFFGEILRRMQRVPTLDIPTLAVGYDVSSDTLMFYYNPEYIRFLYNSKDVVQQDGKVKKNGFAYVQAAIVHELYHVIFGHLNARRYEPHVIWNIATDCAINSIIDATPEYRIDGMSPIHGSWILPGRFGTLPDGSEPSPEQKEAAKMAQIIASLPPGNISEWYYGSILQEGMKNGAIKFTKGRGGAKLPPGINPGPGDGDEDEIDDPIIGNSQDDHSFWDDVPEDKREYVRSKVEGMLEGAAREADKSSNGWGSIPTDLRKEIKASLQRTVDWRRVLKQFVGQTLRGSKKNSMKRINKKYPYIHPGRKYSYVAKICVAIDQSGSVDDGMLCRFFGELGGLTKKVEVDVLPFDCDAHEKDIFTWRKGQQLDAKRVRGGGTDFNAVNKIVNHPNNRGRWDGVIILTDGEAPKPGPSMVKRAWLLAENHKLMFEADNEMVITMGEKDKNKGSWR